MKIITVFLAFLLLPCSVFAQQISTIRELLSSQGKVLYGDEPNSLVVIDYPENLDSIGEYLAAMDVSPQQVFIEARVVEVALTKEHSLGVNWTLFADTTNGPGLDLKRHFNLPWNIKLTGDSTASALTQNLPYLNTNWPPGQELLGSQTPFTLTIFDENISVVLKTLANSLNTDILSAPRITTVNNRPAEIKVIKRIPWAEPTVTTTDTGTSVTWNVNFEEVGIKLGVVPTINEEDHISMELMPEISEKTSDYQLTIPNGAEDIDYFIPVIDNRTASTKVVIGNGQTLIIGGLIKDRNDKQEVKVPLFGDIPVLGYLFKSVKKVKTKSELLIFVSPVIVKDKQFSQMAREAQFGTGKLSYDELQRHEKQTQSLESSEHAKKERLRDTLSALSRQQKELAGERAKLQELVAREERETERLKETKAPAK